MEDLILWGDRYENVHPIWAISESIASMKLIGRLNGSFEGYKIADVARKLP